MKYFVGPGGGRQIVVNLAKGEDICEGIRAALGELGVRDAIIVGAVGSARKMRYHYVASAQDDPENVFVTVDMACEIGALQGLALDGDIHAHVAFSDAAGRAYNGHLEPGCEVLYLLEVAIIEMPGLALKRRKDAFGVSFIDWRQEEETP